MSFWQTAGIQSPKTREWKKPEEGQSQNVKLQPSFEWGKRKGIRPSRNVAAWDSGHTESEGAKKGRELLLAHQNGGISSLHWTTRGNFLGPAGRGGRKQQENRANGNTLQCGTLKISQNHEVSPRTLEKKPGEKSRRKGETRGWRRPDYGYLRKGRPENAKCGAGKGFGEPKKHRRKDRKKKKGEEAFPKRKKL